MKSTGGFSTKNPEANADTPPIKNDAALVSENCTDLRFNGSWPSCDDSRRFFWREKKKKKTYILPIFFLVTMSG